jgi:hypothetical protein
MDRTVPRDRGLVVEPNGPPDGLDTALLERALYAIHSGYDVEEVVAALQADEGAVVGTASRWIDAARASDPVLAWSLLYATDLAELGSDEVVDLYEREGLRPIEPGREGACWTHADLDQLVAVQASEALGRRAAAGDGRALDALLRIVEGQPMVAVRVAAARAAQDAVPDAAARLEVLLGDDAECLRWEVVSFESLVVDAVEERDERRREPRVEPPPEATPRRGA